MKYIVRYIINAARWYQFELWVDVINLNSMLNFSVTHEMLISNKRKLK